MTKLDKKLADWLSQNLISKEQAERIASYEHSRASSSWVLYGFLTLGVMTIGVGIISLIAANWKDIPDNAKLFLDFVLLAGVAGGVYYAWEQKKPILYELLIITFMMLCLASIGLISQIFHTGGHLYQALLLWSVMTLGVAAAAKRYFAPFLWASGFFIGLMLGIGDIFKAFFGKNLPSLYMALPLLAAQLAVLCRMASGNSAQTKAFRNWAILSGFIAMMTVEFQPFLKRQADILSPYFPAYLLAFTLTISLWLSGEYKRSQKILLYVALGLYLVPFHLPYFGIHTSLVYAVLSLALLCDLAILLASLRQRKLFQIFLIAIGLRFLGLYFQAIGGLAYTGLGLIFSGGMIIYVVIAWNKHRHKIMTWAEGLVT